MRDLFTPDFLRGADRASKTFISLKRFFAERERAQTTVAATSAEQLFARGGIGDLHAAGSPCVDFSPMGRRRGYQGPSMLLYMLWCALVRRALPTIIVFENVVQFPMAVLLDTLGDIYCINAIVVDAVTWLGAVRRKRRYALLTLRGAGKLTAPLAGLHEFHTGRVPAVDGRTLFTEDLPPEQLTPARAAVADGYARRCPGFSSSSLADLSQYPDTRPRRTLAGRPCFTVTRGSATIWCARERRCLTGQEILNAQGFPTSADMCLSLGVPYIDTSLISRSRLAGFSGNAMAVPCIGALVHWAMAHFVSGSCPSAAGAGEPPSLDKTTIDTSPAPPTSQATSPADAPRSTTTQISTSRSATGMFHASPTCTEPVTENKPSTSRAADPAPDLPADETSPASPACVTLPLWLQKTASLLEDSLIALRPALVGFERTGVDEEGPSTGRSRDLYPLPSISPTFAADIMDGDCDAGLVQPVVQLSNSAVAGLNALAGCGAPTSSVRLTKVRRAVLERVIGKVVRMLKRLRSLEEVPGEMALGLLIDDADVTGESKAKKLDGMACDLLDTSAGVEPLKYVPSDVSAVLSSPDALFGATGIERCQPGRIPREDRSQYALLVLRQLRCGKVQLHGSIAAGAGIFPIAKKGTTAQREVWNGSALSALARRPLRPPHLASPTSLLYLEGSEQLPLRVWKRDARCFFDQLQTPQGIRRCLGRPGLHLRELLSCHLVSGGRERAITDNELAAFCSHMGPIDLDAFVFPCCASWPMGFSWSSFIAQSTLLAQCNRVGLTDDRMLADDLLPPSRGTLRFALATDDVMIFDRAAADTDTRDMPGHHAAAALDAELERAGIQRHPKKDENGRTSTTVIGIDLDNGRYLVPEGTKLQRLMVGVCHLLELCLELSGDEMAAILGTCSWFAALSRPVFSCFHQVYEFSRERGTGRAAVPASVRAELCLFVALCPLLEADTWREWQDCVVASDASSVFGFGVSVANCSPTVTRDIANTCTMPATYIRLDRSVAHPDEEQERPRKGTPCKVPLGRGCFRTVIASKAQHKAHSGSLETTAVVLALRWLLRKASRHARRTLLLIDAQAVVGAVAKGRSSAPSIRRGVMRVAALLLAGDLQPYYGYIPSEENPADTPSRGVWRTWRRQRRGTRASGEVRKRHLKT